MGDFWIAIFGLLTGLTIAVAIALAMLVMDAFRTSKIDEPEDHENKENRK